MKQFKLAIFIGVILGMTNSFGQASRYKTLIFPFQSVGIDGETLLSCEELFKIELSRYDSIKILPTGNLYTLLQDSLCEEIQCAAQIGKDRGADRVVLATLYRIGEKVIVRYRLVDVDAAGILIEDKTTAANVEDLDVVMVRVAKSIAWIVPIEKTVEVGIITEQESKNERRRGAHAYGGFTFGYLYPQKGYDNVKRSFCMDFRTGTEFNKYDVGMLLAVRKGFAMNIYTSYLFTRKDFCPYIGGAIGFHWVSHADEYYYGDYYHEYEKKRGDGFELTANTGLRLYHTYHLQIVFNFAYSYTLNDFDDQALIFTMGLWK